MVLVETSVIIDYLKGTDNHKTALFDSILTARTEYAISVYTYLEVLQGARDDHELNTLEEYFSSQQIIYPPVHNDFYRNSALNYYKLRRRGISPRSTIDLLIATLAIEYKLPLLHNDRDFDLMTGHLTELVILEGVR